MKAELDYHLANKRVEVQRFFQMAHNWKYGITISCKSDTDAYRQHGHIPAYVCEYLLHLKGKA